ncbi:MAG: hypothetical protein R2856_30105 [Caldilineaceae bacterium]
MHAPFHGFGAQEAADEAQRRIDGLLSQFAAAGVNREKHGPPKLLSPHLHLTWLESASWCQRTALLEQTVHENGTGIRSRGKALG